jgi:deoxyribodipyrimidine photolyase-related protein
MALWCDGGLSMRKPYISGDGYIMKMGNFERGEWNDIWNAVFYHFVVRNKEKLKHTYYAGMIKNWEKKFKTEQTKMIELSSKVIANITR